MTRSWVATELETGAILADLPDLEVEDISDTISRYESTQAALPLPTAPPGWERLTLPLGTCMHLIDDIGDGSPPVVLWGGVVLDDERTEADEVPLSLATLPAYFNRRFVGNKSYDGVGQNTIVSDLVSSYVASGSQGGIPLRTQIVNGGAGKLRVKNYTDDEDKTVYDALTELTGIIAGPEWYVGWEYLRNPERITPVLFVGDRVGTPPAPDLGPAATFEMPGAVTSFSFKRDYKEGKGANDVLATSSASADVRPQSEHVVIPDPERPTVEYRFTPSTSITKTTTLDEHARGKAALLSGGAVTLSLTAALDDAPALGRDWNLGDDIGYNLGGLVEDNQGDYESVPSLPGGRQGLARAIGWRIDFGDIDTITPTLAGGSS